jgi:molybdate transport repressor ModE-like protein
MQAATQPNDLNDLRLVAAIAHAGSLAGAARQLGVNHATAFRRLEKFEAALGVRLFERSAGRYAATPAGEELARAGAAIDIKAAQSLRKVVGQDLRPGGVVRVTTTNSFAALFIGPIAARCRAEYPDIHLHVVTANVIHDLSRRDADIALRPSMRPPEHLIGKRIGTLAHAVYGAKRYLRTRRKLSELAEHDWIALDDSLSQHATLKWLAKTVALDGVKLRTNSFTGVQQACAEGLGLAVLPCFLGDAHRALQRVTGTLDECSKDLWLLTHPDLRHTTRVKAVFQVMFEELSAAADLFAGKNG